MSKILLTGQTGFIGNYLSKLLIKNNFQVLMTEKDYYRINHLKHEAGKIKYLKVSLTIDDKEKLLKTIKCHF